MCNPIRRTLLAVVAIACAALTSGCPNGECNGTPWLPKLAAPAQTAPDDGAIFDQFPRDTTLVWDAVDGAATYDVEIDCFLCCAPDDWCTNIGEPPLYSVSGLAAPQYEFPWVGAQPGRWRVRAVRADGQAGDWSDWREFNYTV